MACSCSNARTPRSFSWTHSACFLPRGQIVKLDCCRWGSGTRRSKDGYKNECPRNDETTEGQIYHSFPLCCFSSYSFLWWCSSRLIFMYTIELELWHGALIVLELFQLSETVTDSFRPCDWVSVVPQQRTHCFAEHLSWHWGCVRFFFWMLIISREMYRLHSPNPQLRARAGKYSKNIKSWYC